ncbi:hypothetical protein [Alkalimonas amylolytica]|uniref:hypothetical protein n=2 Tax=Alkalimonas amylolytica TaxID=152573 RepID=UPI00111499D0|nr:hypothetical protein [Alkalimonas amylolytica]
MIFSRFERSSVDEMKSILISDSTLSVKDKVQLEKMIARLDAKKSPYLSDYEIHQLKQKEIDIRQSRIFVLITWSISIIAVIYFGALPGRTGMIYWSQEPGLFITCLVIWISVGVYFYANSEDT